MQTIYDRIEALIAAKRITKKAFCQANGISTGNFGDWKRGKSSPGAAVLIQIAEYFDVSLDWLMTGKERRNGKPSVVERREDYFFGPNGQLNCRFEALTEQERAFIQEYLDFVSYRKRRASESPKEPPAPR